MWISLALIAAGVVCLLVLVSVLCSCGDRCQSLRDRQAALAWIAGGGATLGGAGGLAAAAQDDDRRDVRLGVGIAAAVSAAGATAAIAAGQVTAAELELYCQREPDELELTDGGTP
jgi:hypothetical protein